MLIKKSLFEKDGDLKSKCFLFKIENGNIYFTDYRTNGYELQLKQGDCIVAILILRPKEMVEFKKLFTEAQK